MNLFGLHEAFGAWLFSLPHDCRKAHESFQLTNHLEPIVALPTTSRHSRRICRIKSLDRGISMSFPVPSSSRGPCRIRMRHPMCRNSYPECSSSQSNRQVKLWKKVRLFATSQDLAEQTVHYPALRSSLPSTPSASLNAGVLPTHFWGLATAIKREASSEAPPVRRLDV